MSNTIPWLRYRVPLGFLMAAWYLWVAEPSSYWIFLLSAVWVLLGCGLRSWAAGYLLKGKRVAVGGPYAYIRNPLYVGSFLIGISFCLALWRSPLPAANLLFWLVFIVGFGVFYPAKSQREEAELSAALGDEYRRYLEKVPAFIPARGRVADLGNQQFSGELYKRNREYQCLLGSAAMLAYLYWRYRNAI